MTTTRADKAAITFDELLEANRLENAKWQSWFERQPAKVLEVPISIAGMKNVRELLLHIMAVELRYAERLNNLPITQYEQIPTGTIATLFEAGQRAERLYRDFLARATDEDLARVIEFPTRTAGTMRASQRKMSRTPCCTACATGRSWQPRCARPDIRPIGRTIFCSTASLNDLSKLCERWHHKPGTL